MVCAFYHVLISFFFPLWSLFLVFLFTSHYNICLSPPQGYEVYNECLCLAQHDNIFCLSIQVDLRYMNVLFLVQFYTQILRNVVENPILFLSWCKQTCTCFSCDLMNCGFLFQVARQHAVKNSVIIFDFSTEQRMEAKAKQCFRVYTQKWLNNLQTSLCLSLYQYIAFNNVTLPLQLIFEHVAILEAVLEDENK